MKMFTGLIESIGTVKKIAARENYLVMTIAHELQPNNLKIGDSVACDGACLTVKSIKNKQFSAELSQETIARTVAGNYRGDSQINLERAVRAGDRLDGHFVSGHIDETGTIAEMKTIGQSVYLRVQFSDEYDKWVVEKGSIAINGVSLTINEAGKGWCSVNLIPHTLEHTNLASLKENHKVNVEFDLLGKYAVKAAGLQNSNTVTFAKLKESGW
jgi:riboflavin synthase